MTDPTEVQGAPETNGAAPAQGAPEVTPDVKVPDSITMTRAEYDAIRSDGDKSKGYVVALTQQLSRLMQERDQAPEMPPQERRAAVKQLIDEDPETALNAHFEQRIAPIVSQQRQTLASINKERAIDKIGKDDWGKWGSKVEEFMSGMDESIKATPGAWEDAYDMVRIKNIDAIVEERVRAKLAEQQRGSLLEGSSSNAAATRTDQQLTQLERTIAKEFGMTDEEWRKYGGQTNPEDA